MSQIATEAPREARRRESVRAFVLSGLGPGTVIAGIVWALVQPYRLTILHPRGQGFWWLFVEPPLLVMLVGVLFHFLILPGLLEDLQEAEE
jgi:ABC-type amino acid transport system permease subunit